MLLALIHDILSTRLLWMSVAVYSLTRLLLMFLERDDSADTPLINDNAKKTQKN